MAVFRFLINVDKCLDMSHYQCFFYKLKSRGVNGQSLFHLSEAQLLEADPFSLRNAVSDVRMYLDKYPYEVEDYRIILMMRCPYTQATEKWEGSVLDRLLRLRYEFRKSRIMLSSAVEAERENALNFIMLYDADFSADLPQLQPYFSSDRLSQDIKQLLQKYGVKEDAVGIDALTQGLEATRLQTAQKAEDPASYASAHEADLLLRYCRDYTKEDEQLEGDNSILALLTTYTKALLFNYRVYERFINRSDRREETLSFLRLTDFVNHPTEPTLDVSNRTTISTLAERCDKAWEEVWEDKDAKSRYAKMLASYSQKLRASAQALDNPAFPTGINTMLPPLNEPGESAIVSKKGAFDEDSEEKRRREDVLEKLQNYVKKRFYGKNFREQWNQTYQEIWDVLNNLKGSLRIYAQDLSRQYTEILAERKAATTIRMNEELAAKPEAKEQLEIVDEKKAKILNKLKEPHMNPAMSFQDVLNSEQRLEQASKNISFYLDCIRETVFSNFLLLLAVCAGFFVLHYTVLQPYALTGADTLFYYLVYIAAAIMLMFAAFGLPYGYYSRCVKSCIKALSDELKVYIRGYYERAKYFSEYINYINRLDYLTRHHNLLSRALKRGHNLTMGQLWHRDQILKHLQMLNYFSGLIESAPVSTLDTKAVDVSVISNGQIADVVDCPVYWPED